MTKFEILEGVNEESFNKDVENFRLRIRTLSCMLLNSVYNSDILSHWQKVELETLANRLEISYRNIGNWRFQGEKKMQAELDF